MKKFANRKIYANVKSLWDAAKKQKKILGRRDLRKHLKRELDKELKN
jgi:hypothetical protein